MSASGHAVAFAAPAGTRGAALGYEPPADEPNAGRVWIASGGSHRVAAPDEAFRSRLLHAVLDFRIVDGARLVLLGAEVAALRPAERAALRARIGFLPRNGGLISHLNGWENIALPMGYHDPRRLREAAPRVYPLLEELGTEPGRLLSKLPEDMTLYEKKVAGYVRILLEAPDLVLVEDLNGGLEPGERAKAAGFASAYLARCPQGTFVQLEGAPDA